jgi:hypothetical protein
MTVNLAFSWQPLEAFPLFSATIQVMLEETEQQHNYILWLKNKGHQIEKELIKRIVSFYQAQLGNAMYYEEQLQRWASSNSGASTKMLGPIFDLVDKLGTVKKTSYSFIETANELQTSPNPNCKYTLYKIIYTNCFFVLTATN